MNAIKDQSLPSSIDSNRFIYLSTNNNNEPITQVTIPPNETIQRPVDNIPTDSNPVISNSSDNFGDLKLNKNNEYLVLNGNNEDNILIHKHEDLVMLDSELKHDSNMNELERKEKGVCDLEQVNPENMTQIKPNQIEKSNLDHNSSSVFLCDVINEHVVSSSSDNFKPMPMNQKTKQDEFQLELREPNIYETRPDEDLANMVKMTMKSPAKNIRNSNAPYAESNIIGDLKNQFDPEINHENYEELLEKPLLFEKLLDNSPDLLNETDLLENSISKSKIDRLFLENQSKQKNLIQNEDFLLLESSSKKQKNAIPSNQILSPMKDKLLLTQRKSDIIPSSKKVFSAAQAFSAGFFAKSHSRFLLSHCSLNNTPNCLNASVFSEASDLLAHLDNQAMIVNRSMLFTDLDNNLLFPKNEDIACNEIPHELVIIKELENEIKADDYKNVIEGNLQMDEKDEIIQNHANINLEATDNANSNISFSNGINSTSQKDHNHAFSTYNKISNLFCSEKFQSESPNHSMPLVETNQPIHPNKKELYDQHISQVPSINSRTQFIKEIIQESNQMDLEDFQSLGNSSSIPVNSLEQDHQVISSKELGKKRNSSILEEISLNEADSKSNINLLKKNSLMKKPNTNSMSNKPPKAPSYLERKIQQLNQNSNMEKCTFGDFKKSFSKIEKEKMATIERKKAEQDKFNDLNEDSLTQNKLQDDIHQTQQHPDLYASQNFKKPSSRRESLSMANEDKLNKGKIPDKESTNLKRKYDALNANNNTPNIKDVEEPYFKRLKIIEPCESLESVLSKSLKKIPKIQLEKIKIKEKEEVEKANELKEKAVNMKELVFKLEVELEDPLSKLNNLMTSDMKSGTGTIAKENNPQSVNNNNLTNTKKVINNIEKTPSQAHTKAMVQPEFDTTVINQNLSNTGKGPSINPKSASFSKFNLAKCTTCTNCQGPLNDKPLTKTLKSTHKFQTPSLKKINREKIECSLCNSATIFNEGSNSMALPKNQNGLKSQGYLLT